MVNSYFWNVQYLYVKSSWLELPSDTAKDMQMKLNIPRSSPASLDTLSESSVSQETLQSCYP